MILSEPTYTRLRIAIASLAIVVTSLTGSVDAESFVKRHDGPQGALTGKTIALWPSHGRYYNQETDRWQWQRPRLFGTVEDLYTSSYVLPFLIPMLENSGAYVMTPRERDTSPMEIIIDGDGGLAFDGYHEHSGKHHWKDAGIPGFAHHNATLLDHDNPFVQGNARMVRSVTKHDNVSTAQWHATIPKSGTYAVYVSYVSLPESVSDANYTVLAADGRHSFTVDQRKGGGTWVYLGSFPFTADKRHHAIVELTNHSSEKGMVTADAVKIGGGMGNVARHGANADYNVSGYPRFTEAARYYLQWAGAPDSVYCVTEGESDYTDDFKSRGLWVNWLLGGSEKLPGQEGLGIDVDMAMGFHSDAGQATADSIIGTLGIYCTERRGRFADGRSRLLSRRLTDSIVSSVVRTASSRYRPDWTRRKMRDRPYAEARMPQVPAMLLELLSHQNPADMRLGLDPQFRFDISRAVYKGIVKYFAATEKRPYTIQPLPVKAFAIKRGTGSNEYVLQWQPSADPAEPTARPSSYIVEERIDNGVFTTLTTTTEPRLCVNIDDHHIHSYRITARNKGGVSFPSEVLALYHGHHGHNREFVTIVNGFTRTSGPQWSESGDIGGFDYQSDMGVPYGHDMAFTGHQYDFDRNSEFMTNDSPGFGASHAEYETQTIAGNTFDFVYRHGAAIKSAGYPFVSSSAEAFAADTLTHAPIVDLILGKQREVMYPDSTVRFQIYTPEMQHRLTSLTAQGTSILVSGSFVASDIWKNDRATPLDKAFTSSVLGYQLSTPKASTCGMVNEVPSRFKAFRQGIYSFNTRPSETMYPVESPDAIAPSSEQGAVIMRYADTGNSAAIAVATPAYKTIIMGFPIESITSEVQIRELMKQCLNFFNSSSSHHE